MKIAITSTGNTVESPVDHRFGRCSYFAVVDTTTHYVQFVLNTAADSSQGAGPAAVQLLAGHQVERVVSGDFGAKVKPLMASLSIEMQTFDQGQISVLDIIKEFK